MVEILVQQRFAAPAEKVFAAVTDHKRIEQWQAGTKVTMEKLGTPSPNGLGAIRKVGGGPVAVWEEVVRWEEPRAMDYRVIRGFPLRDHLGEIRLSPAPGGGTQLDYRIRYWVPWWLGGNVVGRVLGQQLQKVIAKAMEKLAVELESSSTA